MTSTTPSRHRARLTLALAATALVAPALLAGCAPKASGDPDAASTGVSSSESAELGRCLRDAGYDVDDPDLSQGIIVAPPDGADQDAYSDAFFQCAEEVGGSLAAADEPPSADEIATLQKANLKVAACVREKGFEDFPDPVDGYFDLRFGTGDPSPRDAAYFACDAEFGPYGDGDGDDASGGGSPGTAGGGTSAGEK